MSLLHWFVIMRTAAASSLAKNGEVDLIDKDLVSIMLTQWNKVFLLNRYTPTSVGVLAQICFTNAQVRVAGDTVTIQDPEKGDWEIKVANGRPLWYQPAEQSFNPNMAKKALEDFFKDMNYFGQDPIHIFEEFTIGLMAEKCRFDWPSFRD